MFRNELKKANYNGCPLIKFTHRSLTVTEVPLTVRLCVQQSLWQPQVEKNEAQVLFYSSN